MNVPAWRAELDQRLRVKLAGKHILLACNEDDITALVTDALAPYGCTLEVVTTAVAARAAAGDRTNLLLLRLVLPAIAGRQLLGFFRIRATADVPIIVLRRRGDPRVGRREMEEARVDRILDVPCDESELWAALDAFWPEARQG